MFHTDMVSHTAAKVQEIMTLLQAKPGVLGAALSTPDGLAVIPTSPNTQQMAAVSGFMLAAASQAALMLNMQSIGELTLLGRYHLTCQPFQAGNFDLILTVMVERHANYRRHLLCTIKAIQQAMKN